MMSKCKIELPSCGLLLGNAIYNCCAGYLLGSGYGYSSWSADSSTPLELIDLTVKENQGNIVQFWWFDGSRRPQTRARFLALEDLNITIPPPDFKNGKNITLGEFEVFEKYNQERAGAGVLKALEYARDKGLYSTMIYCHNVNPAISAEFEKVGPSYIGYDFGEMFSFRYEDAGAFAVNNVTLKSLTDDLVKRISDHVREKKEAGFGAICCTSGNSYMDYEVIAGVDYTLFEDCTAELNITTALSRGLCKQHDLGVWGSHIANEYYTWIPWDNPYRFETLRTEMCMKYLSGAKIIISESGAWHVQSAGSPQQRETPRILKPIGPTPDEQWLPFAEEAQQYFKKMDRDSDYCRNYRRIMSDFYDYVKEHGTPEGQPEVTFALAKGNYDLCAFGLDMYDPCHVIGGAHALADQDIRWFASHPERGWEIASKVFWPRPAGIYGDETYNRIFSGTPYGQIDIVSFACDKIDVDFLSKNYKALAFVGWNTCSPEQYSILTEYVKCGGKLFISIPQFSQDITRNFTNYTVNDLVNGGDLSELCGLKVKGRGPRFYWASAPCFEPNCLGVAATSGRGFGVFYGQLGDVEFTDPAIETLLFDQEAVCPILLRRKLGEGEVFFLNSWYYPGFYAKECSTQSTQNDPGMIGAILQYLAKITRPGVYMTGRGMDDPDGECSFVNIAHYPDQNWTLLCNIDFEKAHTVDVHFPDGSVETVTLAPQELRNIKK